MEHRLEKPPRASWWNEARAVLVKDLRSELRTRAAVATILLFALSTLVIVAFMVPTEGPGLTQVVNPEFVTSGGGKALLPFIDAVGTTRERAALLSALLWILLFFSAMVGLPRAFV